MHISALYQSFDAFDFNIDKEMYLTASMTFFNAHLRTFSLLQALKSPQKFRTLSCSSANFLGSWYILSLKSKSYYEIWTPWISLQVFLLQNVLRRGLVFHPISSPNHLRIFLWSSQLPIWLQEKQQEESSQSWHLFRPWKWSIQERWSSRRLTRQISTIARRGQTE